MLAAPGGEGEVDFRNAIGLCRNGSRDSARQRRRCKWPGSASFAGPLGGKAIRNQTSHSECGRYEDPNVYQVCDATRWTNHGREYDRTAPRNYSGILIFPDQTVAIASSEQ